ncbi:MAG: ester cyclase [Pseudomonadota bacterium]
MSKQSVTHVATTDIREMMNPGAERRMDLPGFDPEFVDFPHYIIRITERIWHDRDVDLCLKYYADSCVIHTMAGPISGAQTVVDNTNQTLASFPDRRLDGDNVIWSEDAPGVFYSSHLITSKMTNHGPSEFGAATGKRARVQTIADCLCKENQVVEEWLVRDNGALCLQLGFSLEETAERQAKADIAANASLLDKLTHYRTGAEHRAVSAETQASRIAVGALEAIWGAKELERLSEFYDFRVGTHYPSGREAYGYDQLSEQLGSILDALPDAVLSIDHICEIPYLGEAVDVAARWTVRGHHNGDGAYGAPSGAPIFILAVSHFRIMNGRIREETTIWDDLALHRQIATARLLT